MRPLSIGQIFRPVGYGQKTAVDLFFERERELREETRKRKESPACQFDRKYDDETKHLCGRYRSWKNVLLSQVEAPLIFSLDEDDLPYGRCVLLRSVWVLPECRGNNHATSFITKLTGIAEKTNALLMAVCSPLEYDWIPIAESLNAEEKLKYVAERWTEHDSAMKVFDVREKKYRDKQRRMKQRFLDCGFQPINIRRSMSDAKKYGYWSFAYVPRGIDSEFMDKIRWRFPKLRKKKES